MSDLDFIKNALLDHIQREIDQDKFEREQVAAQEDALTFDNDEENN